jgi:hypothetical protein
VRDLVEQYLPGAQIIHPDINVGLAKALFTLQETSYQLPNAEWGIFLEDDLVLESNYLEVLEHFIELSDAEPEVVKVSACQVHTGYLTHPPVIKNRSLFLGEGTKAVAERATFFEQRRPIMESYIEALAGSSYRHRDRAKVFASLAQHGIFRVMGNNDGVLDQCVAYFKKIHVTFERDLLDDIGVVGESNFVMPAVKVASASEATNPLAVTSADLQHALPILRSEILTIQNQYFEDMWQVYRRADSVQHTVKFIASKSLARLRKRLSR